MDTLTTTAWTEGEVRSTLFRYMHNFCMRMLQQFVLTVTVKQLQIGDGVHPYLISVQVECGNRNLSASHRVDDVIDDSTIDVALSHLKVQLRNQTMSLVSVEKKIARKQPGCKIGVSLEMVGDKPSAVFKWGKNAYECPINIDASYGVLYQQLIGAVDAVVPEH